MYIHIYFHIFIDISNDGAATAFTMDPSIYDKSVDKLGKRKKRSKKRDSNFKKSLNVHQINLLEKSEEIGSGPGSAAGGNEPSEDSDRLTKLNTLRNATVNGSVVEGSQEGTDDDRSGGQDSGYAFYNPRPISTRNKVRGFGLGYNEDLEQTASDMNDSYNSNSNSIDLDPGSPSRSPSRIPIESNVAQLNVSNSNTRVRSGSRDSSDSWQNELEFIKNVKVTEKIGDSILKRDSIMRHNDKTKERKRVRIVDNVVNVDNSNVDPSSPEPYVDESRGSVTTRGWYQCLCCGVINISDWTKRVAENNSLTRLRTFLTVAIAFDLMVSLAVMILSIWTLVQTAWIGEEVAQQRLQAWTTVLVLLLSSFLVAVNYVG